MKCLLCSDFHGNENKYYNLFSFIEDVKPTGVFIAGDLLPSMMSHRYSSDEFIVNFLGRNFRSLKQKMGDEYPEVFLIMGNDDERMFEEALINAGQELWIYCHMKRIRFQDLTICGYSYVPPTPFTCKDWERYDVSRFVDPGCLSPLEGRRTFEVSEYDMKWRTIKDDLAELFHDLTPDKTIGLFHTPPYKTNLDRAALDGMTFEHAPLDVHVGSIALQRFIARWQPWMTMHGHVHEASEITGNFIDKSGRTVMLGAAYSGPETSIVIFDPYKPESAIRKLLI